ncbi:glycosyl transferase family 1 [Devosia sp. 1566]|uniref:glycosyl transferase family 1 n=1 Tax=Devosia sp. 1566 TaxID=2499144 RepID=UPI000FD7CF2F|nr:glycosyl transferase family 1 [Devosia sp. 1566]
MPSIVYLVPNLADPAVARRIAMLRAGGATVSVAGFLRGGAVVPELHVRHCVCLGHTFDARFTQRIAAVLRGLLRITSRLANWPRPDLIIARNLEMLPLARRLQNRWARQPQLVYECLDIHRLLLRQDWLGRSLRAAERHWSSTAALLITSSPGFLRHYFDAQSSLPSLLLENKVLLTQGAIPPAPRTMRPNGVIRIGWFGALRCQRSLDALAALSDRCNGRVEVVLRGRPALSEFRDFFAQIAGHPHLRFLGPYSAAELPQIYAEVDASWTIDFFEEGQNSAWLLPNRLYEGCRFGAIPIAVAGTETAGYLQRHGLGVVVPDIAAATLDNMVAQLTPERMERLAAAVAQAEPTQFAHGAEDCRALVARLASLGSAETQAAGALA